MQMVKGLLHVRALSQRAVPHEEIGRVRMESRMLYRFLRFWRYKLYPNDKEFWGKVRRCIATGADPLLSTLFSTTVDWRWCGGAAADRCGIRGGG